MQMCPECGKIYDESDYARCPYCSGELSDEDVEYDDYVEYEFGEDPGWDYVYDEDGEGVDCPICGAELRYHDGSCCCLECNSTFSDDRIETWAGGPWHHS
ncbi:MAG: hypothetical protein K5771_08840 [Oscillospiraceae bacterium]|nr:hypothetical protein [Oscillospiraceae bacterium]